MDEGNLNLPDPDWIKSTFYETGTSLDLDMLVRHLESLNEIILSQNERIQNLEEALKSERKVSEAATKTVRKTDKVVHDGAWPFPTRSQSK